MPKAKRVLFWPDTHFPSHDPTAVAVAKKVMTAVKPDESVFMGDILDCNAFGSHPKSQVKQGEITDYLEIEVKPAKALLDYAAKQSASVVYLEGNHEYRVERHCANTRGADAYFSAVDPKRLLSEGRSKFTWVPYLDVAGGVYNTHVISDALALSSPLVATHGWSVAKRAAAAHLDVGCGVSVVFGHTHRAETVINRDPWTDHPIIAMGLGCLSQLSKPYTGSKPTGWTHGLGLAYIGRRSWTLYHIPIMGNECVLPDGKQIRV